MVVLRGRNRPSYSTNFWQDFEPREIVNHVQSAHYGVYNDYGWVEGLDEKEYNERYRDERPDLRSVFVHKDVMDVVARLRPKNPPEINAKLMGLLFPDEPPIFVEHMGHVHSLCVFACDCRIDLVSGLKCKGSQHVPKNYDDLIDLMRRRTTYEAWFSDK